MATQEITNQDNVIDSRDVIARIEQLEAEHEDGDDAGSEELAALKAFAAEGEKYSEDWEHGATLIHIDYFTDYCQELCEDIGDIPKSLPDYIVIDWEATADNLKVDYTPIEFDGETYYVR